MYVMLLNGMSFVVWMVSVIMITSNQNAKMLLALLVGRLIGDLCVIYMQEKDDNSITYDEKQRLFKLLKRN